MPELQRPTAILLMALGGPDSLESVEPFLKEVRGGRPTPPELIEDVRERYRITGGKSPVPAIMKDVSRLLEQKLNGPGGERYRVYVGYRHWKPFIKQAYEELMDDLPERVIGLCMAPQYSSMSVAAYQKKVEEARTALGDSRPVTFVNSWHCHPKLIQAFADSIAAALQKFPADVRGRVPVLFTAHSLPERIVQMNDPYPKEVQGTVEAVCARLGAPPSRVAFQSQGRTDETWLGPTVEDTLADLAREGHRHVLIAPIGFVSDHLEVLYDVDVHFKKRAESLGLHLERMAMLNASPALIETLAAVVQEHEQAS
jgi:ferrochelatase